LYRCEVRCNLKRIGDIVDQLDDLFVNDNFGYFLAKDFFKVIQINIGKFLDLIRVSPAVEDQSFISASVYSVIAEYIMKTLYLAGSKPTSAFKGRFNRIINRKMIRYTNAIGVLTNMKRVIKRVFRALSDDEKLDLLDNQVVYAPCLNSLRKNLLRNIAVLSG
jgi:hypothetical protein